MVTLRSVLAAVAALALPALTGCGARSALVDPAPDADAGEEDAATPVRACGPDCTIGHHCCVGSCDGPAVVLPSDCCECLPGEVSSFLCTDDTCGG